MPAPETNSQERLQPGETFPNEHASDARHRLRGPGRGAARRELLWGKGAHQGWGRGPRGAARAGCPARGLAGHPLLRAEGPPAAGGDGLGGVGPGLDGSSQGSAEGFARLPRGLGGD